VKWLTLVKPEKNAWPASALFQCSLIRSDAAAAGHKTTQRRRRPPFRRRTALLLGALERPLPYWRRRRSRKTNTWLTRTIKADLGPLCRLQTVLLQHGFRQTVENDTRMSERQCSDDYANEDEDIRRNYRLTSNTSFVIVLCAFICTNNYLHVK